MNGTDTSKNQRDQTKLQTLMLLYVFGGIFGFLYEEIFYLIDLGYLVKRGITFGPWIPIYGFGAVFIALATERLRRYPAAVFAVSGLVSGTVEYVTGYVLLRFFDVRLWDYNTEIWNWGNIGGFICLRSILFFGLSGLILQYLAHPLIDRLSARLSAKTMWWLAAVPAALFLADTAVSAINRMIAM